MKGMVGTGILLIILTVLFGWIGGGICILAGLLVGVVLIVVGLVNPEKKDEIPSRLSDRYCPGCGRAIRFDVRICPYCGKKFDDNFPIDENEKTKKFVEELKKKLNKSEIKICQSCGYENKINSKFCKKCGRRLDE